MNRARVTTARLGMRSALAFGIIAVLATASPSRAARPCTGDCNDDGRVAVSELVIGINIAGNLQPLDQCVIFDASMNESVAIEELVQGVSYGLNGCPESFCGDGFVDLEAGETCDDGNADEGCGDTCPADCRIVACEPSGSTVTVDVNFASDIPGLLLAGLTPFVSYPDGVVDIPGRDDDPSVLARVTSQSFSVTPNDQNYGLCSVLLDPTFAGVPPGTAITIEFDLCSGAAAPSAEQFGCVVEDAADVNLTPVTDDVSCSVVVR